MPAAGRAVIAAAAFLLVAAAIVGLHVRAYPVLSPIDELQHYDYAVKASELRLVRDGERVGQVAMAAEACRGIDAPGFGKPPCTNGPYDPGTFQELGYNTAASQSPVYYAITGTAGRLILALPFVDDRFVATRLAGFLWLAGGLLLTWLLMDELEVPLPQRAGPLLILAFAPVVLHATAVINTDGILMVSGGSLVLVTLRWARGATQWYVPPLVAMGSLVNEPTNVLAVGVVAAFLVFTTVRRRGDDHANGRRDTAVPRTGMALLIIVAALLGLVSSIVFRKAIALDIPPVTLPKDTVLASSGLTAEHVLGQVNALLTPLSNPYLPPPLRSVVVPPLLLLTNGFLLAAAGAAALLGRPRASALSAATILIMVLAGPALVVWNELGSGVFFPIPSRYGLSLVPALLALVGTALPRRAAQLVATVLGSTWAVTILLLLA